MNVKISEKTLLKLLLIWTFCLYLIFGLNGPPNFWDLYEGGRYRFLAEDFVQGQGYQGFLQIVPLYPIILSLLLLLFGYAPWPILLLHASFGVMTVFFTYKTAHLLFNPTIALIAGGLISVHPYLLKLTMQILETGPSIALTTFGMWLFVSGWLSKPINLKSYILSGLIFALATLTRPTAAVYIVALGVGAVGWASIYRHTRLTIVAVAIFWVVWAIVMSPWWIHNYVRYGHFIPLANHGGFQFLKGHAPYYDRVHPIYDTDHIAYFRAPVYALDDPDGGYFLNQKYMQQAWRYIKEDPSRAVITDLRKILWLYNWHKVPRSLVDSQPRWDPVSKQVVDDGNPRPGFQELIYSMYWIPTLIFFLLGLFFSHSYWRKLYPIYLIVLANLLVVMLAFADTRYRLDVDPYISIWAAYGLVFVFIKLMRKWSIKIPSTDLLLGSKPA